MIALVLAAAWADRARAAEPDPPGDAPAAAARDEPIVARTADGIRLGVIGPKPPRPAPTVVILAVDVERVIKGEQYREVYRWLAPQGWVLATLDPPCHGEDLRPGEPKELAGWAARVAAGEDLAGPFVERAGAVLDWLIDQGWSDPERIAAVGTSRGGYLALQWAAREPRVRAVVGFSPVTRLDALDEFSAIEPRVLAPLAVAAQAPRLAGRAIWLSIGSRDARVETAACVATAQRLVEAAVAADPQALPPVWLEVLPARGHQTPPGAERRAADWLRATLQPSGPR